MFKFLTQLGCDTRGATAIEYGLILALVFIAMITTVDAVAKVTIDMWNDVSDNVTAAVGS